MPYGRALVPPPPPPGWRPPPVRRGHPVLFASCLTLSVLGVVLLAFVVVVTLATAEPDRPSRRTTAPATTRPTSARATKPSPTTSTRKPKPKTEEQQAWERLRGNAVNKVRFPAKASCSAAKTDPNKLSRAQMKTWVTKLISQCLTPMWGKTLGKYHVQLPMPSVVVADGPVDSPCGTVTPDEAPAFHCSGGLYFFRRELQKGWGSWGPWGIYNTVGHEYGHYVQFQTDILSDRALLSSGRSTSQRNALTRRVELQATCMAGMFIASIGWTMPGWDYDYVRKNVGGEGDSTHGTNANQTYWATRGMKSRNAAQCNTWTAKSHLT